MTKPLFYCLVMTVKGAHSYSKCFSPASIMRPLQIIANPLKIRGQVQVVHPTGETNPALNEEIEEEVGNLIAASFPKWKPQGDDNWSNDDHLLVEVHVLTSPLQIQMQYLVFIEPMEGANENSIWGQEY